MRWLLLTSAAACILQSAMTARILALCVTPSPSHGLWCYKYLDALAERGHQVTVLGVYEPKIKIANLTKFIAHNVIDNFQSIEEPMWAGETSSKTKMLDPDLKQFNEMTTKFMLQSGALEDLLRHHGDTAFDLIVHDSATCEALLALVPLFGDPPLVLFTPWGMPQWMLSRSGNILNPAYMPNMLSEFRQTMSFLERCENLYYYVFVEWFYNYVLTPFQDKMAHERFGSDLPSVREIAKRASIIFVVNHFAFNGPQPLLPGVISLAGFHITPPKPLPQDIKEFMDGAENGVILMSFGTNVQSSWLPHDFEVQVIDALRQLPQRVIWKWEKEVKNLPPNVRVSKWLPQGDMFYHPKMRLFVSHCGLASTHEALFHKLPIVALPVFFDQVVLAKALVRHNATVYVNVYELTTKHLFDAIMEVLGNPMYKRNMEKLGELMRDTPMTARQLAVYWTEYALRHDGAPHLRSIAADLPWYQLLLLDIVGAVLLAVVTCVWTLKLVINYLLQSRSKSKKE